MNRMVNALLLASALLASAAQPDPTQQPSQPPPKKDEKSEKKEAPKPKARTYSLTVSVVTATDSVESPLSAAQVALHADDYDDARTTAADGKVSFKFTTAAAKLTLRVTAAHRNPYQQPLKLQTTASTYTLKVLLKKSE